MSTYADTIRELQRAIRTAYAASQGHHPVFYPATSGGGVAVSTMNAWTTVYTTVARPVGAQVGARVHVIGGGGPVRLRLTCAAPALTGVQSDQFTTGVVDVTLDVAAVDPLTYVTLNVQAFLVNGSASRVAVVDSWVR